ncbi:hypothetical protein DOZ80_30650 [Pseudomonas fluorescens]|uniref:Uncharacterized protein n=1 Tax=Pseudomonas fluorescens TaxID=294 RepID=A0A327MK11_PSEFL|nr:hypothetical protein DOZ80_30650 [Pseudomonas fluorescens]
MLEECFQHEFNKSVSGPKYALSKNFNPTHWSIAPRPTGWFNERFFNRIDQESGLRIYLGSPSQIKEPVMALTTGIE